MPRCGVVGCGTKKNDNQKSLSLHRLPRSEFRRIKWLEAIGTENIRPNQKEIYICSLHFPESALNKTLGVIRLRDDAIPLQFYGKSSTGADDPDLLTETNCRKVNIPGQTPVADHLNLLNLPPVESEVDIVATDPVPGLSGVQKLMVPLESIVSVIATDPLSGTSGVRKLLLPVESIVSAIARDPLSGTSGFRKLMLPVESIRRTITTQPVPDTVRAPPTREQTKIKQLEDTCVSLRRKVRALNEKVRRLKAKLQARPEPVVYALVIDEAPVRKSKRNSR